jgi:tetratricopeptide (TPR) repeat protein
LEEAVWIAEVARHEEVSAEAACNLVYVTGYLQARFDVGEIWSRLTEAILRRMGGHELLWSWYHTNRGSMREQQGRLTEAIEDARRAVVEQERVLGPESAHVAGSLTSLANHLAYGVDFEQALEVNQRALDIATKALGRDHPVTARVKANHAQYLVRLGRFDDALPAVRAALSVLERETDPRSILVTFAMRTLGLCCLGTGRFEEAISVLERALSIREAIGVPPFRRAEVRSPLARALFDGGGDRTRALGLARKAVSEYAESAKTPVVTRDLAELEAWLATRAEEARPPRRPRRGAKRAGKAPPKARPQSASTSRSRRRR